MLFTEAPYHTNKQEKWVKRLGKRDLRMHLATEISDQNIQSFILQCINFEKVHN